jgi:HSP20 family protein
MANLARSDPFTDLAASWQRDIERIFQSLEGLGGRGNGRGDRGAWLPATDVLTRGDDLVVRVEIPGIDPENDVEVTVEDGMLHIRGQRRETQEERGEGYIRRETAFGAFERVIALPPGANTEGLRAEYDDGVLEVVVPGAARRPTQRVQVEGRKSDRRRGDEGTGDGGAQASDQSEATGQEADAGQAA